MVEVKLVEEAIAKELFEKSGITFFENLSQAMCAKEGDAQLGFCLFDITKDKISVKFISNEEDFSLADGLLRSALFLAANRGIMAADREDTLSGALVKKLGFSEDEQNHSIDITNLFSSCENCKKR